MGFSLANLYWDPATSSLKKVKCPSKVAIHCSGYPNLGAGMYDVTQTRQCDGGECLGLGGFPTCSDSRDAYLCEAGKACTYTKTYKQGVVFPAGWDECNYD